MPRIPGYPARVLRGVLLGLPGVAVLPFLLSAPEGIPATALVINPLVLLILAALAGGWAAPRAGVGSLLVLGSQSPLRPVFLWLISGLAAGLAVALLDHALADVWEIGLPTLRENRDVADLALGLLYGGLTEEILMRWGLMSLLAVSLMKFLPKRASLWTAAVVAAILFGLAHLPAVSVEVGTLTATLFLRTLLWNGLLGLAFGAAFLRVGLEAAILAHMGVHLGFSLAAL